MNKRTRILITCFFALLIGLGAVFYFVSKKIDPQMLRKNIVAEIERVIPGSQASIGEIDFSIGVRAKIYLEQIVVKDDSKRDLLRINRTEVEVPVFDILKGGGRLEVKVQDPIISLPNSHIKTADLSGKLSSSAKSSVKRRDKTVITMPSFVKRSRWDLKIENLKLLAPHDGEHIVKKIIFKNLNLKKTTAFEIVSDFTYSFSDERTLSSQAQAVGEINFADLIDGKLGVNMLVNSERATLSWSDSEIPPLKSVIKLKGSTKKNFDLSLRTTGANSVSLETDMTFSEGCCDKVSINRLESSVSLNSLYQFLSADIKGKLKNLNWGNAKLNLNGTALYEKGELFRPSLEFSLDAPISFKQSLANHAISFNGHYVGDNLSVKFTDDVLDGVVTLDASTTYSPFMKFDSKIEGKLLLTSLKIKKEMAKAFLYETSNLNSDQQPRPSKNNKLKNSQEEDYGFLPFDFVIEGKHIYLNDQEMNISGKLISSKNKIKTEDLRVILGSGEMAVQASYKGPMLKTKFTLKNAEMAALNSLLPPFVNQLTGIFSGSVRGDFDLGSAGVYTINGGLSGKNGSLEGLDLAKVFSPILQKIPNIQKIDAQALKEAHKFKSLKVKGTFTEIASEVDLFELESSSGKINLQAKGSVYNSLEKESAVKAMVLGRFFETMPSNKGLDRLYFLLTGKGVRIQPRLQYTLDMMNSKTKLVQ